jgi:arsenite methyltransferase
VSAQPSVRPSAAEVKSCCADLYGSDWARLLLGESFHPGGTRLTDRLAELIDIGPGARVLDVAAGRGRSAVHLAARRRCVVVGVDLSAANVAAATEAARSAAVGDLVSFQQGDAESLDVPEGSFDAVICECAFCTFPDKPAAARAIARTLRPGGKVGLSDLTRNGALPAELEGLLAWVACTADAQPVSSYVAIFADAGLQVDTVEAHDDALVDMIDAVREKLRAAHIMVELGRLSLPGTDLRAARSLARSARHAVLDGRLGYAILCGSSAPGGARVK